jgi:hypothetical protein
MTAKKTLKKRVRDRQAHTGESYTAALSKVLAQAPDRPGDDLVVELIDLSAQAARLGWKCRVAAWPDLAARADLTVVLDHLHGALQALGNDALISVMRAAVLQGIHPPSAHGSPADLMTEAGQFATRVRAGIGGASTGGTMLAFQAPAARHGQDLVVCWLRPFPESIAALVGDSEQEALRQRYPSLLLGTAANVERPMWFLVP